MSINIRPIAAEDAEASARIIYEAFKSIHDRHRFARDFETVEAAQQLVGLMLHHPEVYGVVAEEDGRIVGSNFLWEQNSIKGVGPITVDPEIQARGTGRRLMEAVLERGRGADGIRLVQDSFNTLSLPLYAALGFDVQEPLALVKGTPRSQPLPGIEVRPLRSDDLRACAALSERIHGFARAGELRDALELFAPLVAVRAGRITAYAAAPTFWQLNHGVAETEEDMRALLLGAGAANTEPLALLLPTRQAKLFRWCLSEGLRVVKPMTLMTTGLYQEPEGAYFPSVLY